MHITLVRNSSDLSTEVENYIKDKNLEYIVLFIDETIDVPQIMVPGSVYPLYGRPGFNMFKTFNLEKYVNNEERV